MFPQAEQEVAFCRVNNACRENGCTPLLNPLQNLPVAFHLQHRLRQTLHAFTSFSVSGFGSFGAFGGFGL